MSKRAPNLKYNYQLVLIMLVELRCKQKVFACQVALQGLGNTSISTHDLIRIKRADQLTLHLNHQTINKHFNKIHSRPDVSH